MAKTSLALVFALVLALPIYSSSAFVDEVNPWKNLFDEEINVGSLEEVPNPNFVDHLETQDWVQEASDLHNKKIQRETSKETPAPAPKVSAPKCAPAASPKTAPKAAPKVASPNMAPRRISMGSPKLAPKKAPMASPKLSPRSAPTKAPASF